MLTGQKMLLFVGLGLSLSACKKEQKEWCTERMDCVDGSEEDFDFCMEEVKIYKKLLENSELSTAPCSPSNLETLAQFSILSRLEEPDNSSTFSKMRVYDGETL